MINSNTNSNTPFIHTREDVYVMLTERRAIEELLEDYKREKKDHHQAIHDIRNEINNIRNEEKVLLQRLRDLDERDMKSNSIDVMENLANKLIDVTGNMAEIIPSISAPDMIEHLQKNGKINADLVEGVGENAAAAEEKTEVEKAAQQQKIHSKPKRYLSKEHNTSLIKTILQESGKEMNKLDIEEEFFNRCGVKYRNFSEQINRAMNQYPVITRTGRGLYKIKSPSLLEYSSQLQEVAPVN